jgi:hypothetical protein
MDDSMSEGNFNLSANTGFENENTRTVTVKSKMNSFTEESDDNFDFNEIDDPAF